MINIGFNHKLKDVDLGVFYMNKRNIYYKMYFAAELPIDKWQKYTHDTHFGSDTFALRTTKYELIHLCLKIQ